MIQADLAAIFGKSHDQASESCDRSKPDALMLPKVDSEEHLAEVSVSKVCFSSLDYYDSKVF